MSVYFEVYEIVRTIPRGRVLTYGLISHMISKRLTAQGVGWALRALRGAEEIKKEAKTAANKAAVAAGKKSKVVYHSGNVPWHRVINASGGISTTRNTEMPPDLQQELLEAEGVEFNHEGKIDLARYLFVTG